MNGEEDKTPSGQVLGEEDEARGGEPQKAPIEESVKLDEPVKVMAVDMGNVEEAAAIEVRMEVKVTEDEKILPTFQEKEAEEVEPEREVKPAAEVKSEDERVIFQKNGEVVKESDDEYEKGERLDLGDNDHGYESEEFVGVEFDKKDLELEDLQKEEYPIKGGVGEEEDGDMVEEEEIEEVQEKLEGEGDHARADDNVEEEHVQIVDHEEEDEHHEIFKERRKHREFEVFVRGLDKDVSELDLQKVFSEVGEVTEVRLMMNPQTKDNKGFAFLRFATVEQAKRACSELKNPVVHGKQCGVAPSQDHVTLFLVNICKSWTKEALRERLKHYGVDNAVDITLVKDNNSEGINRAFAFLEFSSRSDATDAFKRLQKRDVVFGVDRPAKVSFADSFIDPGDEVMAQVKTIFVDGLPASWDEDRVRELLKTYGKIEKVELACNMPWTMRKDFGFVTFSTHDAAVICAISIHNEELGEGDSKVRARLSRPRGESRHGHSAFHHVRPPWSRPAPHAIPFRGARSVAARLPPVMERGFKRQSSFRDRRQVVAIRPRPRPAVPVQWSYDRRQPIPPYPRSSPRRYYVRRKEATPQRSRVVAENSRVPSERCVLYRDGYSSHSATYPVLPRGPSRPAGRRDYADGRYVQRYDRPPPAYHEQHGCDYDPMPGSKRAYSALDDVPPCYTEAGVHPSHARLVYEHSGNATEYGDGYGGRPGRLNLGYAGGRKSISSQDSHGLYSSRKGSYLESDRSSGKYSSGYGSENTTRGGNVGGSSYSSSLYSGRVP